MDTLMRALPPTAQVRLLCAGTAFPPFPPGPSLSRPLSTPRRPHSALSPRAAPLPAPRFAQVAAQEGKYLARLLSTTKLRPLPGAPPARLENRNPTIEAWVPMPDVAPLFV